MNQDFTRPPMQGNSKQPRVLKWSIIIGIIIVLNMFFTYALSLAYPAPTLETFCPSSQVMTTPDTQKECVAQGGQWTENVYPQAPIPSATGSKDATAPITEGYCNPTYTCQNSYDTANQTYQRNVFAILISLGIISIIVGVFIKNADAVSVGLSFGGVLSLIIASTRYWAEAGGIVRVVILAAALVALIWLGIKKLKN